MERHAASRREHRPVTQRTTMRPSKESGGTHRPAVPAANRSYATRSQSDHATAVPMAVTSQNRTVTFVSGQPESSK